MAAGIGTTFSAVGGVGEANGGREGSGTRDVGEDADIARWRQRRPEELVRRLLGGVKRSHQWQWGSGRQTR